MNDLEDWDYYSDRDNERFKFVASHCDSFVNRFPTPPPPPSSSPPPQNATQTIAKPHIYLQVHKYNFADDVWNSDEFQIPSEHKTPSPTLSPIQQVFILNSLDCPTVSIIEQFFICFRQSRATCSQTDMEKFVFDLRWMAKQVVWSARELRILHVAADEYKDKYQVYTDLVNEWLLYPKTLATVAEEYARIQEEVWKRTMAGLEQAMDWAFHGSHGV